MNVSFDGRPVEFEIRSSHVVLIDPLALDGLSRHLAEIGNAPGTDQASRITALGTLGLRIGLHAVPDGGGGIYAVDAGSFEAVEPGSSSPRTFDADSGSVVIIDLGALSLVAQVLTWDRLDSLLRAPVGDWSILEDINREVGGPRFAIVSSDIDRPFSGDGTFQMTDDVPARVG